MAWCYIVGYYKTVSLRTSVIEATKCLAMNIEYAIWKLAFGMGMTQLANVSISAYIEIHVRWRLF